MPSRLPPLPDAFVEPPRSCSLAPFWFWNDDLDEHEICRQIDDFHDHGVYAFVIHPRVGLPRSLPFMGEALLGYMRVAVEHAARRGMWVILYDEGMYPSGAAGGLVVAENPAYACRGLVKQPLASSQPPVLPPGHHIVAVLEDRGQPIAVVDRPIDSWVRGLHYLDHDTPRDPRGANRFDIDQPLGAPMTQEAQPAAADLLNPEAMQAFIRIVYDGYADALGEYFGTTIRAVFTDEPMLLGRGNPYNARPGTTGIMEHVNAWFGRDVTSDMPLLWHDTAEAKRFAADYTRAVKARLAQTYYRPLHDWCERHGLALTGHPHQADDLGLERYFHWPGQDVIWHEVRPGPPALHGTPATQAKVAASAKAHHGRQRNANEYMGAYGHKVTRAQLQWVTNWLLVRGCDLLIPHAFFYSVRGARIDECPPQLGPHGRFWDTFKPYADTCRRLCWLNMTGRPVVKVAILAEDDHCPFDAAAVLLRRQIDFHYVTCDELRRQAAIDRDGVAVAGYRYAAIIVDGIDLPPDVSERLRLPAQHGRVIHWGGESDAARSMGMPCDGSADDLVAAVASLECLDLVCASPTPDLRVRHVVMDTPNGGGDWYVLFNEGQADLTAEVRLPVAGQPWVVDPTSTTMQPLSGSAISLPPGGVTLLYLPGGSGLDG